MTDVSDTLAYDMSRPIRRSFYEDIQKRYRHHGTVHSRTVLPADIGLCLDVAAGEVLAVELIEGPQIVNMFAVNSQDPDERIWVHNSSAVEGAYLRVFSRLWGTMARFRPLLTVLDDTVVTRPRVGRISGKHHFLFGGWGTPADWKRGGGSPGIATTWDKLVSAMGTRGWGPDLLTTDVCLFQKTAIDPYSQEMRIEGSDAVVGDRIVFFAEIDLTLVLALSPYQDGSRPARELDGSVRKVAALSYGTMATPLGWPYDGFPYPELAPYVDDHSCRTTQSTKGAGLR